MARLDENPLASQQEHTAWAGEPEGAGNSEALSSTNRDRPAPLFAGDEAERFRHRWNEIQAQFVDEPRTSVEQADGLVADVIERLSEVFAHERADLEARWDRGDQISTEDLRVTLQKYRSFFGRLVSGQFSTGYQA